MFASGGTTVSGVGFSSLSARVTAQNQAKSPARDQASRAHHQTGEGNCKTRYPSSSEAECLADQARWLSCSSPPHPANDRGDVRRKPCIRKPAHCSAIVSAPPDKLRAPTQSRAAHDSDKRLAPPTIRLLRATMPWLDRPLPLRLPLSSYSDRFC